MSHFSTGKIFLAPSFDLDVKEREKIDKFLYFLEDSSVGEIISNYIKNRPSFGGRPNCNYYRLFATIIYGFAFDKYTLRGIASACRFDLRYIYLMEQIRLDHSTIAKFINKVIVPNEAEIFSLLCKQIIKETGIRLEDAFVDGTKIEANANKYRFVWKPIAFHKRLSVTFFGLIDRIGILKEHRKEELVSSKTVAEAITQLDRLKGDLPDAEYGDCLKALEAMLTKAIEYESKETICGPGRKSYYKTDPDATAMCLKEDYYSGLGSNMHAAYNVQALVISGFVLAYHVSQDRNDSVCFIPVIEAFHSNFGVFPKRICADAGYGNLKNYQYLDDKKIESFVKNQSWEGNVSASRPDAYQLNDDERTITCLNGNVGHQVELEDRHPRKAGVVFFKVEGCNGCEFRPYCKRFMRAQNEDHKIFEVVIRQQKYKQQAEKNLLSPKGIEIRVNRSIQAEGAFGILKQDYKRDRFNRRSLEKVSAETMLCFLGMNIAKLFRFYEKGALSKFWVAPESLQPQERKKPSAKRLAKKGSRTNTKMMNGT